MVGDLRWLLPAGPGPEHPQTHEPRGAAPRAGERARPPGRAPRRTLRPVRHARPDPSGAPPMNARQGLFAGLLAAALALMVHDADLAEFGLILAALVLLGSMIMHAAPRPPRIPPASPWGITREELQGLHD